MSCYFRHLKEIFAEAGIEVTPGNRKQIDQAIHDMMGVAYKDCPATWREVKQELLGDKEEMAELVKKSGLPPARIRSATLTAPCYCEARSFGAKQ